MEPIVAAAQENLRLTRDEYRRALTGMSPEAINWTPGEEMNSAAVLITHISGSEGEILRIIQQLPSDRDRASEFLASGTSAEELLAQLDAAEAAFDELAPGITAEDLESPRTRVNGQTRTGMGWLFHNMTHLREHLGHIQLTRQLWDQQHGTDPDSAGAAPSR